MTLVVIDTGVLISALYWHTEASRCLQAWEGGAYQIAVTLPVFGEYQDAAWRVREKMGFDTDPTPMLELIQEHAEWVEPVRLGKPTCRDAKDDKFLEAALGAGARVLIARDADLCDLEKPFGIEILTPRAFLSRLPRQFRQGRRAAGR